VGWTKGDGTGHRVKIHPARWQIDMKAYFTAVRNGREERRSLQGMREPKRTPTQPSKPLEEWRFNANRLVSECAPGLELIRRREHMIRGLVESIPTAEWPAVAAELKPEVREWIESWKVAA